MAESAAANPPEPPVEDESDYHVVPPVGWLAATGDGALVGIVGSERGRGPATTTAGAESIWTPVVRKYQGPERMGFEPLRYPRGADVLPAVPAWALRRDPENPDVYEQSIDALDRIPAGERAVCFSAAVLHRLASAALACSSDRVPFVMLRFVGRPGSPERMDGPVQVVVGDEGSGRLHLEGVVMPMKMNNMPVLALRELAALREEAGMATEEGGTGECSKVVGP